MKSAVLILTLTGHLTIGPAYECRPTAMVDGVPIYDCGKYRPDQILTPEKCTFNVMTRDGLVTTVSAPCDGQLPGAIISTPPPRDKPSPKYQKRME